MKEAGVEKVFIATDGVDGEREELKQEFGDAVYFYNPTPEEEKKFKKGGVAIIDQENISNILYKYNNILYNSCLNWVIVQGVQVKVYLYSERFRLKFCRESVTWVSTVWLFSAEFQMKPLASNVIYYYTSQEAVLD